MAAEKTCPDCHGTGAVICNDDDADRYPCSRCETTASHRARIDIARQILDALRREVQKAQREGRGGQHAGIARYAATRPSVLADLDRELGEALAALAGEAPR